MIDQAVAVPAIGVAVGAIAGAIGGWLAKRAEKAPDIQSILSDAIAKVVEHYKAALDRSDEEAAELRGEVAEMRRMIEAQSAEIELLVKQIGSLEQQIVDLGGQPIRRPRARAKEVQA